MFKMSKKIITLTSPMLASCLITQHSRAANQLNVEGDSMELPLARMPSTGGMVINNATSPLEILNLHR